MEKRINNRQRSSFQGLVDILARKGYLEVHVKDLMEKYDLTKQQATEVMATVGLIFHHLGRNEDHGLPRHHIQMLAGILINNPGGARQVREEQHGVIHPPLCRHHTHGHSP